MYETSKNLGGGIKYSHSKIVWMGVFQRQRDECASQYELSNGINTTVKDRSQVR